MTPRQELLATLIAERDAPVPAPRPGACRVGPTAALLRYEIPGHEPYRDDLVPAKVPAPPVAQPRRVAAAPAVTPEPPESQPRWRDAAACLGEPLEIFFEDFAGALKICDGCPVIAPCLEDAMSTEAWRGTSGRYGIRGGLTPAARAALRRARVKASGGKAGAE